MPARKIIRYPAEILKNSARRVGRKDLTQVRELIRDMLETLADEKGVGLAAPQVGVALRVCVAFDPEIEKTWVFINPSVMREEGEEIDEEGCLSFPGLVGLIPRATKIWVKYHDEDLREKRETFEGLLARIVQHEIDHLNGITIKDTSIVELYEPKIKEESLRSARKEN